MMFVELHSKFGAQSGSMDTDAHSSESMAGDESGDLVTQAQPVGGKRHLWDHKNPYYGFGVRGREKSGISSQYKRTGRLPRFGPQGCVIP